MPLHLPKPRWPIAVACTLNALILLALILLYRPMHPNPTGTFEVLPPAPITTK